MLSILWFRRAWFCWKLADNDRANARIRAGHQFTHNTRARSAAANASRQPTMRRGAAAKASPSTDTPLDQPLAGDDEPITIVVDAVPVPSYDNSVPQNSPGGNHI